MKVLLAKNLICGTCYAPLDTMDKPDGSFTLVCRNEHCAEYGVNYIPPSFDLMTELYAHRILVASAGFGRVRNA